jgi:protease-4
MQGRKIARALGLAAGVALLQGCIIIPVGGFGSNDYSEVELRPGSARSKILVLDIDGEITSGPASGGLFSSESTVVGVTEKLRKAADDSAVKAIVLRIDSPGGGVTASDIVYREVMQFRKENDIPVYTSMLDLCASGGYYIAMASDEVYASPTTVTGSIGVIAMFPQLKGLGDKLGVGMEVVKSGPNKDMGGFWKSMSQEERALLQGIIDDMYGNFVEIVHENRKEAGLSMERVRELADGRVYTAEQAKEAGLVDGIKYLDEVIDHAAKENGMKNPKVVMYRRSASDGRKATLYARTAPALRPAASGTTTVNMVNVDMGNALAPKGPVFHYLWLP